MIAANGFCVTQGGALDPRNVADTPRAAMVNWLWRLRIVVLDHATDEQIGAMFNQYAVQMGAKVEPVIIHTAPEKFS